ncbi:MAG TPA: alpha/beta fold hydrolase [Actinomycetota bacterium]|nr:alpha/beta fold hydrolase [Actinomycetota bacterium]
MAGTTAGWVSVGRTRTRYLEAGSGPPVVLLHGSGPGVSALANWRLALPALGGWFRVLAPDLVGFGETEVRGRIETRLDTWVIHAAGFIEALGLGRVDVVGNSMGGAVALGLAARRPELVGRVVTMGTVGVRFPITEALDRVWGYRPSLEAMRELIGLFAHDPFLAEDEELVRLRFEASADPGTSERYAALFPPPRQRWVDALALTDEELAGIRQPVLLVHGLEDRVVPWEATTRRIAGLVPDARVCLFPRCGHWVQLERADEFHRLVRWFFG